MMLPPLPPLREGQVQQCLAFRYSLLQATAGRAVELVRVSEMSGSAAGCVHTPALRLSFSRWLSSLMLMVREW